MLRLIIIAFLSFLLTGCAASPKYRGSQPSSQPDSRPTGYNPKPKKFKYVAGIEQPDVPFSGPDYLINAKSLKTIKGVASWYGPNFNGNLTANGEVYDMNRNSAAHKEFPFNTWIRVTNLKNGKVIVTRINDRGPYVKGRILDLSKAAAQALDMIIDGTARIKIEILEWGI